MHSVLRHLSPIVRSRRHSPIFFSIAILLTISFNIFIISHHRQPKDNIQEAIQIPYKQSKSLLKKYILNQNSISTFKKHSWPLDEKGRSLKTEFLVLDWTGFFGGGATEGERVECPSSNTVFIWTRQQNRLNNIDFIISHDGQAGWNIPFDRLQLNKDKQQYAMAFVMESEVHSSTGDGWSKFHFKMTYNLDDSYPEPATYFDMNTYLVDLLTPPLIPYENKEKSADVVWIISNCNAHNGRQTFIQRLMKEIQIDSYGSCLNNRQGYRSRMTDNIQAYQKYKFVIAIENSNCVDYVTEKLVKVVAAGSIPIVAGRDGRPDYRRYMPEHSYINIFDYASIKELADDIKRIANNKTLYESYLWYKNHSNDILNIKQSSLDDKLKHLANIIGKNATMLVHGIAGKEKSENKVCKLIRFVRQTPWQDIAQHKKTIRAGSDVVCLSVRNIVNYFESTTKNNSRA